MKKIFVSVLASAAVLLSGVGLAACSATPSEHDHVWDGGEVTAQATCKEEGSKLFRCTVSGCKETKTEAIGKTAHTWNEGEVTQQPTCKDFGVKTFTCGVCNETRTEQVDKSDHTYDGGTLTKTPTLTAAGETTYKCGVCGGTKTESVAARDDFAEHFYTSVAEASAWQYGYTDDYNGETGAFTFTRIAQTDEEQPAVWKADGVAIERNKIYSSGNAVIAYTVNADMQLSITAAFVGEEQETRVGAYLSVADADGAIRGEAISLDGEEKDWSYASEEDIEVKAGDCLYIVFANAGTGAPSGAFSCRLTSPCRHIWNDGEETKSASCTELGEKTYTCNLCGETKTEEIAMTAHNFTGAWTEVNGGHAHKCADCAAVDTDNAVSHNSVEDESKRVPATCHSDGVKTMVCSDCGAETTEAITERPEHSWSGWEEAEDGHRKHCLTEGCGELGDIVPHNMRDGEIIKQPSATEQGQKESICSDCGYKTIIYLPTTDHTASNEYGSDKDYHWFICGAHTDCGEKVDKKAHEFKELTDLREEPTCKDDGKSFWKCVCGAEKEEAIPNDGVQHTMDEGVVTTQPTFWADGVKTYTCEVCGHTETEAIARLNSTTTDTNDASWKFGTVAYHFPDTGDNREYFAFSQATDKNSGGDGFIKDGTEIKNTWFSGANFDTFICVAFTFNEDVNADMSVSFKGIGGDDGVLSDYSLRIGYNDTPEWGDRGTEYTVNKTHEFKAGDTVYFIFKHEANGWDQGNFSITINRVAESQN